MKIIHTGDWHIGKIVNEFSMLEDQEFILEQLIKVIEEEKPNALVIAGDLYDRSMPPVEAVALLDRTFSKILLDLKTPILVIAGNHDSAERVGFGNKILTKNGLHIAGVFEKEFNKITLKDEYGDVKFYLIPYVEPRAARNILQNEEISTHDDAMRFVVENIKEHMKENERNVMIAHGYVAFMKDKEMENIEGDVHKELGLDTCDSERPLSIGGTDLINGEYFKAFNYTALGHLHGHQKVGSDNIRYSGSLLKYSFSEVSHRKGVNIVEIGDHGEVTVNLKELIPKRDMRIIKGPLQELISPEIYRNSNVEDYVYAILTDEGEIVDPISQLRAVYPNIMGLNREEKRDREESRTSATNGYKSKTKLQLFEEFYQSICGNDLSYEKLNIMKDIIEETDKEVK